MRTGKSTPNNDLTYKLNDNVKSHITSFPADHEIFKGKFPSRVTNPLSIVKIGIVVVHMSRRETIPKPTYCFSDGGDRKRRFPGVQYLPYQRMGSKYGEFHRSVYVPTKLQ